MPAVVLAESTSPRRIRVGVRTVDAVAARAASVRIREVRRGVRVVEVRVDRVVRGTSRASPYGWFGDRRSPRDSTCTHRSSCSEARCSAVVARSVGIVNRVAHRALLRRRAVSRRGASGLLRCSQSRSKSAQLPLATHVRSKRARGHRKQYGQSDDRDQGCSLHERTFLKRSYQYSS